MKHTPFRAAGAIALSAMLLTGCAASVPDAPAEPDTPQGVVQPVDGEEQPADEQPAEDAFSAAYDAISGCDQVGAAVAPYIEGLVLDPDSGAGEWSVGCFWDPPEGITEFSQIRSVEVIISNDEGGAAPDTSLLLKMDGSALHEDPWLDAHGGVAYSLTIGTAVAAVITTTVWVPGVEVSVTGGQWADYPALDGPASIRVAQALLGG